MARQLMNEEAGWLGMGFAALLHAYSPEVVVMGGGVSQAFDLVERGLRAAIRARALPAFRDVPVRQAALGDNSGLIGAAALAGEAAHVPHPVGD